MEDTITFRIKEFEKFYNLLMLTAPEGYIAWFFPLEPNGKNPSVKAILKINPDSKGSWHNESACLTKEQCIEHIKNGYNIGISARKGDKLIIIDIDSEEFLSQVPPETLTVTSRKRTGCHAFGWDKDGSAKINLPTDKGEVRSDNQYVVACGSCVPFNLREEKDKIVYDALPDTIKESAYLGYYTVFNAQPPRDLCFDDLPLFFKEKARENLEAEVKIKQAEEFREVGEGKYSELFRLKVRDIIGLLPKSRVGHPLHDSTTDADFSISKDGSICHCWRHLVSINAVQFLCIEAKYAKCEDAGTPHKGRGFSKIKGDKKALEVAYQLAVSKQLIREYVPVRRKKKGKEEEDSIRTSLYINEKDKIIAEEIYEKGKIPQFALYNHITKEIQYVPEFVVNGMTYKPITDEEVAKGAVLLPSKAEEYGTDEQLDNDVKAFIHVWLDIPLEFCQFSIWNIKRSWVYETFHSLNYLRAMGDTGQGKTRFLDTLGSIHYKPIMTCGAVTSAPIFRIINKWRGTLVMDEADLRQSDENEQIVKIINMGYERGKFVMRCEQNDASKINFFDAYCPKIIATRKPFDDKAVESRCITHVMLGTRRRDIIFTLTKAFFEEALVLRNKLLMWRFRNYFEIEADVTPTIDLKKLEPRVQQIVTSYFALFAKSEAQLGEFKKFIEEYQEELIGERADSWEGQVVLGIHALIAKGETEISASDIISEAQMTNERGVLYKARALTKVLKELGFGKSILKRVNDIPKRCIPLNREHLEGLFARYGCNDVTFVTNVMGGESNRNETSITTTLDDFSSPKSDTPSLPPEMRNIVTIVTPASQSPTSYTTVTTVTTVTDNIDGSSSLSEPLELIDTEEIDMLLKREAQENAPKTPTVTTVTEPPKLPDFGQLRSDIIGYLDGVQKASYVEIFERVLNKDFERYDDFVAVIKKMSHDGEIVFLSATDFQLVR